MSEEQNSWISVQERLPEIEQAVFVRGKPYDNKGTLVAIGFLDVNGKWYEPDKSFGWLEKLDRCPRGFNDLEEVSDWMPLPDAVMQVLAHGECPECLETIYIWEDECRWCREAHERRTSQPITGRSERDDQIKSGTAKG